MTNEETIRRELWSLVKSIGSQTAMAKKYGLSIGGTFNQILSGRMEPTDRFCQLVGWRKISKGVYEKIIASESAVASDNIR